MELKRYHKLFFVATLFLSLNGWATDIKIEADPPMEKEKIDFGTEIKESTKEVKAAAKDFSKTVEPSKYKPRKTKGKKPRKLKLPREVVNAEDNVQWEHNKKEALKNKEKLDAIENVEEADKKK